MSKAIAGIVVIFALAGASEGIINPNFTPKHLADQSDAIVVGTVAATARPLQWRLSRTAQLKGESAAAQVLNLASCNKDHLDQVKETLKKAGKGPVILFAGTYDEQKRGFLHVQGMWLGMTSPGKGRWDVLGFALQMSGTYAGGTNMLIRMSEYLLKDPDGEVPVTAGVRWIDHAKGGRVAGEIAGLAAVGFGQGRPLHLFVASSAGDRLYRPKKGQYALEDVTTQAKLDTKSLQFVWVDVDRDGLADLVSWTGQAITVRLAGKDGAFRPAGQGWELKLPQACLGLTACSSDGQPGVLVSTPGRPLLLTADAKGGWKKAPLPPCKDAAVLDGLGRPSACVVADLDNDGFADVLQPSEAGGLLWRGAAGGFRPAVKSAVAAGAGTAKAAMGDFDGDGALDVFLGGSQSNSLWENDGRARFKEVLNLAGSMSYKCPPRVSDVQAVDLNHDGRRDLCLAYAGRDLLYHWNRGFRCFGEEGEVRLPGAAGADAGSERIGQKALAVGDFNGDGSRDLAVLLSTGELQVYFNDQMDMPQLRLRLGKGLTGPVTASCWMGDKYKVCVGTASVAGHTPATTLSARYPGAVTVRFRLPGRPAQTRRVTVENATVEVVLDGAGPSPRVK